MVYRHISLVIIFQLKVLLTFYTPYVQTNPRILVSFILQKPSVHIRGTMNHHLLYQAEESERDDVGLGSILVGPDCWWLVLQPNIPRNVGFCKNNDRVHPIKINKDGYGWEIVWGFFFAFGEFFLDSGLDTFCMLFPAFRSWKLLRPNVFTAFWSSMLSFSVLFATF